MKQSIKSKPKTTISPAKNGKEVGDKNKGQNSTIISSLNEMMKEKSIISEQKNYSMLAYLNSKEDQYEYRYKQFRNHSKHSPINETIDILIEMLDKHATQRSLSSSEQYILSGYLGKYVDEISKNSLILKKNHIRLQERLANDNKLTQQQLQNRTHQVLTSPTKSKKKISYIQQYKKKDNNLTKQLSLEFKKVKIMWQIYQLKVLVCPSITITTEAEDAQNRNELTEMFSKLSALQKNKDKNGLDKTLVDVGRIMKKFYQKVMQFLI